MRKFAYNELDVESPVIVTEEEILETYWPYWKSQMIKKYEEGHPFITRENCIEDWQVVHWAWSVEDEG